MHSKKPHLDLGQLVCGQPPGITASLGQFAAEAASVVFEHNSHRSGVKMQVKGYKNFDFVVIWPQVNKNAWRSHNDLPAAAEYGAYGIAFLLARKITRYRVIERSYKGTGVDYYLGTGSGYPFQKAARMEVSGIVNNRNEVESRVRQKLKQTDRSAGTMPAFVVVVDFGQPFSAFEKR